MDTKSANSWKNQTLDVVFEALAESDTLMDCIVFKGARILNKRLDSYTRQSLDIDSNILAEFSAKYSEHEEMKEILRKEIEKAIHTHFEKQEPVVYELDRIKIKRKPNEDHKLGWNAFEIIMFVKDLSRASARGLPNLTIDIAAPEELGKESIAPLKIGGGTINAYTLERIAGEKLRAFLSSLPAYRKKVSKPGHGVRVKDLYDIARITKQYPITSNNFWDKAGEEFLRACKSRYIDCSGIKTFEEDLSITEETYNSDSTLPDDIPFEMAFGSLHDVMEFFEEKEITPFDYPLPDD